jgi:GGDEF domain-containing protein
MMLLEESGGKAFRIGPDEFVLLLTTGRPDTHARMGERIFHRLETESDQVSLRSPAGEVAVIHFKGTENLSAGEILGVFYGAIYDLKQNERLTFKVYEAAVTEPAQDVGWVINDMIKRMAVSLGNMLMNPYPGLYMHHRLTKHALPCASLIMPSSRRKRPTIAVDPSDGDNLQV